MDQSGSWRERTRAKNRARIDAIQQGRAGDINPALVCPHCQTTGQVRTKAVKLKKGVSGGKATGAVLTAGISMLATGLSRKESHTQATCEHCGVSWVI